MVIFRYKGNKPTFGRTDSGRSVNFQPDQVYEFDENNNRYEEFIKKLLTRPGTFEVQSKVGAKDIGGGVRTRRKTSRKPKEVKSKVQAKVDKALKKPKGLRKPKRMKL